jgi:thiopeptide-type bacteriocin biosynthesis protein
MPADHLTAPATAATDTERAVLAVLAGTPTGRAAAESGIGAADLTAAVDVYRLGGRDALNLHDAETGGWHQINIQFLPPSAAESAAEHLAPLLNRAEADGIAAQWWFMRKDPGWRLRLNPGPAGAELKPRIGQALDDLVTDGRIAAWWPGRYETETAAFGGHEAMEVAHRLFHRDSAALLSFLRDGAGLGRRELTVVLCSVLMRGAGLEWYEQGDIWHRVAMERPLPADIPAGKLADMADDLRHLMLADTTPDGPLLGTDGPLATVSDWARAFDEAGRQLGAAARAGTLTRGLRQVLSYHVIFHWNRLGLPTRAQSIVGWAARNAILDLPAAPTTARSAPPTAARVTEARRDDHALRRIAARFPLIARPRLTCPDLTTRVTEAAGYVQDSLTQTRPIDRIERACSGWNLAALIAADSGLPDLAADMCRQQFEIFRTRWPLRGDTAIGSLQPLVNLARLAGRAGDPHAAYQTLIDLDRAVRHSSGDVQIHGTRVSLDGFTRSETDRVKAVKWLRILLCQDVTRAVAGTGDWRLAADYAKSFDDEPDRLYESRQAHTIARIHEGHPDSALALLDTTVISEVWERAVAACLCAYAHLYDGSLDLETVEATAALVRRVRSSSAAPDTAMFRIRLGLTAVDLAASAGHAQADPLCHEMIHDAVESTDAFVAREVLHHPECQARMSATQTVVLSDVIRHAALGRRAIPQPDLAVLTRAVGVAQAVLVEALAAAPR